MKLKGIGKVAVRLFLMNEVFAEDLITIMKMNNEVRTYNLVDNRKKL